MSACHIPSPTRPHDRRVMRYVVGVSTPTAADRNETVIPQLSASTISAGSWTEQRNDVRLWSNSSRKTLALVVAAAADSTDSSTTVVRHWSLAVSTDERVTVTVPDFQRKRTPVNISVASSVASGRIGGNDVE